MKIQRVVPEFLTRHPNLCSLLEGMKGRRTLYVKKGLRGIFRKEVFLSGPNGKQFKFELSRP